MLGIFGRTTRQLALKVLHRNGWEQLRGPLRLASCIGAWIYTDDWCGYRPLSRWRRRHLACWHTPKHRCWALDADGDGQREVHCNSLEGIWTGLRNFLRTFRGVSQGYLAQYAAVYQAGFNRQRDCMSVFRCLLAVITKLGT